MIKCSGDQSLLILIIFCAHPFFFVLHDWLNMMLFNLFSFLLFLTSLFLFIGLNPHFLGWCDWLNEMSINLFYLGSSFAPSFFCARTHTPLFWHDMIDLMWCSSIVFIRIIFCAPFFFRGCTPPPFFARYDWLNAMVINLLILFIFTPLFSFRAISPPPFYRRCDWFNSTSIKLLILAFFLRPFYFFCIHAPSFSWAIWLI